MPTTADLKAGDCLLYYAASNAAFRGLAWAQRVAGLRDAPYAHVGIVSRVGPRGTWADEISAYTDGGGVKKSAKYPWRCAVLRFPDLDPEKAIDFAGGFLGQAYGWTALLWMGMYRKVGFRSLALPKWIGWERVCSPLILGALRSGGVDPLPGLHASLCMPSDFAGVQGEWIGDWSPEGG